MELPSETQQPNSADFPGAHFHDWQDALSRFRRVHEFNPELSEPRIKTLALLWLSFQHARAREIAEFPLFIRPQVSEEGNVDLVSRLYNEINDTSERAWLIEGDAGMGKTTFCYYLCNEYWEAFLAGQQKRIPLYIYLIDDIGQFQKTYLHSVISRQKDRVRQNLLPENVDLTDRDYAWLLQQPLLLILDGFDELPEKQNYYQVKGWGDVAFSYDIKVVYGCRQEALELANRTDLFGAPRGNAKVPTYTAYLLEDLKHTQINDYIDAYVNPAQKLTDLNAAWYRDQLQILPGLEDVIKVPHLLRIVLDIMPAIVQSLAGDAHAAVQQHFTRWRIYEAFVWHWIQKQAARIRRDGHTNQGGALYQLQGSLEGYLFSYISNLASTLWSHSDGPINNRSLRSQDTLRLEFMEPRYRGSIQSGSGAEATHDAEYLKLLRFYQENDKVKVFSLQEGFPPHEAIKIIRSGSLLKIDDKFYKFIHKTIIEYLTMGAMTYNLRNQFAQFLQGLQLDDHSKKSFDINMKPLRSEPGMIVKFVEQFKDDVYFKHLLYEILLSSKTVSGLDYASSNAITILNAMGENFSSEDLSNVQIPYADLRRSIFDNTNFSGANLEGVWFHGAWMRNAIFSGAQLKDVEFGEPNVLKHDSEARSLAFYEATHSASEDNQFWIVGCEDGYVYQWSARTLTVIQKFDIGHNYFSENHPVRYLVVHNESALLLAQGQGGGITLCSLKTGKKIKTLKGTNNEWVIALSPNGQLIATGDQGIRLWSVEKADYLRSLLGLRTTYDYNAKSIAFSPSSEILVIADHKNEVHLLSVDTGNCIKTLASVSNNIFRLSYSPNGEMVAATCSDQSNHLWFINKDNFVLTLPKEVNTQFYISFSYNSDLLYLITLSKLIVWHIPTQTVKLVKEIPIEAIGVVECSFGTIIPVKKDLHMYGSSVSLESLDALALNDLSLSTSMLSLHSNDKLSEIVFDPMSKYFALKGQNHYIYLFLTQTGECIHTFTEHTTYVQGYIFSPDGDFLASWSKNGTVVLCSMRMLDATVIITAHKGKLYDFVFSENSLLFATSGAGDSTKVWSVTGECLMTIPGYCTDMKFYAKDSLIALRVDSGRLSVWSIEKRECVWKFSDDNLYRIEYVMSRDNILIATLSEGRYLQIWSISDSRYHKQYDLGESPQATLLGFLEGNQILALFKSPNLIRLSIDTGSMTKARQLAKFHNAVLADDDILMLYYSDDEHYRGRATQIQAYSAKEPARIQPIAVNHEVIWIQSLYKNSMILVSDKTRFSLFELKTGRYVLGLDLAVNIKKIKFLETQSNVLIALANDNVIESVLCYSYNNLDDVKWKLLWFLGKMPENFNYVQLGYSVNLSYPKFVFLKTQGSIGSPAIPEVVYAPLHSSIVPLPNTSLIGLRPSLVQVKGLHLTLSATIWVISVAKKKIDSQHTFLILEGVVNFRQFIIKADLTTPGKNAIINLVAVDGKSYTLDKFVASTKNYDTQQWQISRESGLKLISNIREDQCTIISYKTLGDQGGKRDKLGYEYHNCVSWSRKQLRLIGIELPGQWYNFIITLPQDVIKLPAATAQPNNTIATTSLATAGSSMFSSSNNFFRITSGDSPRNPRPLIPSHPKETKSVLDNCRLIEDEQWALTLIRNIGTRKVFLILQGQVNHQSMLIFPDKLTPISFSEHSPRLLNSLYHSAQPGVVISAESAKTCLKNLADGHEFQGCLLSAEKAEELLKEVVLRKSGRANSSANMSSLALENADEMQSYIGLLEAVTRFEYSENWHPIQLLDKLESLFSDVPAEASIISALNMGGMANSNN